jgi:hypothetical protein
MLAKSILAASAFALLANAGACTRNYTVKAGDFCDSISAAKNVSTYQLSIINVGIINSACSNLVPGQVLCLGYEGEDCTVTRVVKKNDTCDLITSAEGISSTVFRDNNPQINATCTNLYINEVVCVAKTKIVPPLPKSGVNTAIPPTATPAVSQPSSPKPTSYPPTSSSKPSSSSPPSSPQPSPQPSSDPSEEDDEDLPYCDEL